MNNQEHAEDRNREALLLFGPVKQTMFLDWRFDEMGEATPEGFTWTYDALQKAFTTIVRNGFDTDESGMFVSTITGSGCTVERESDGIVWDTIHYSMRGLSVVTRKLLPGALVRVIAVWPSPLDAKPTSVTAVFRDTDGGIYRITSNYDGAAVGDWLSTAVFDLLETPPCGFKLVDLVGFEANDAVTPVLFTIEIAPRETRHRFAEERAAAIYIDQCGLLVEHLRTIGRALDPKGPKDPSLSSIMARIGRMAICEATSGPLDSDGATYVAALASSVSMWTADAEISDLNNLLRRSGCAMLDLATSTRISTPIGARSGLTVGYNGSTVRIRTQARKWAKYAGSQREPLHRALSVAMEEGRQVTILETGDANAVLRQRDAWMHALLIPDQETAPKHMQLSDLITTLASFPGNRLMQSLEYVSTYSEERDTRDGGHAFRWSAYRSLSMVLEDIQEAIGRYDIAINGSVWMEVEMFGRARITGIRSATSGVLECELGPYEDLPPTSVGSGRPDTIVAPEESP